MLESLGYRVMAAGSGQEAISVYREKKDGIDLVILDMIMTGVSGGETYDRLREIDPGIRVLLASGYSVNGQAQEILDRGCRGFLQKPFTLEALSRKVREALGRLTSVPQRFLKSFESATPNDRPTELLSDPLPLFKSSRSSSLFPIRSIQRHPIDPPERRGKAGGCDAVRGNSKRGLKVSGICDSFPRYLQRYFILRSVCMDYKDSLNLPKTDFPMKANLSKREPEMLARWDEMHIYDRIREASQGRKPYILHDGPPYANGNIHLGTALNKIIKDILIKAKNMTGRDSVYVPGWDCHGLPIEHQVDKELGEKKAAMSQADKRRFCRVYADKYVGIQREQFKRLGVFGEWENPYLTMTYDYEATTVAEFGKLYLNGSVYKGKKPVYWCASCKTALAEAEVEYQDHTTPSIYVKFALHFRYRRASAEARRREGLRRHLDDDPLDDPGKPGHRLPRGFPLCGGEGEGRGPDPREGPPRLLPGRLRLPQ